MKPARKRTPRDHDYSIQTLRAAARRIYEYRDADDWATGNMLLAAAYDQAATYLASITGKVERAAAKGKK